MWATRVAVGFCIAGSAWPGFLSIMSADVIDVTPPSLNEDRTVAILSYITILGFIVAIVIHGNKPTRLGAFHLRQALGLFLFGVALGVGGVVLAIIPFLGWLAILAGWGLFFVTWLLGLLAAINGRSTPSPLVGGYFQKWFAGAFP
ncbi:hypothetical protein MASR2M8_19030 [Opitutaceae bacterium]